VIAIILRIFKSDLCCKILYRNGLKEIRPAKDEDVAEFEIGLSQNHLHKLFESFITRLIEILKNLQESNIVID
jgi:hypothetical protein